MVVVVWGVASERNRDRGRKRKTERREKQRGGKGGRGIATRDSKTTE